jgi:amino acid transporter
LRWKSELTRACSGGAIGAGLFIGSGGAFQNGGPGAVLIGFIIIGFEM